ncbi:hypothetical protein H6G76_08885 [Nostoc sp. FACHB-152]|uniref:hypothetical protein n=1 Tax=unclassified Nostoc TaxID=2593658 RepID=UPI0016866656|nr:MULTISPECIES: hypothetical protein [unclassified Nostoc]MBD2447280.1 hypothetical protein [Nostoc sp. FACHB-152]MBD2468119.1 hypothetical protein [Nostoc sp. FACHB-145]
MLNYPAQLPLGGVFYPQGCVSQLLTVPNWTVACGGQPPQNCPKLVKNSKSTRQ